MTLSLNENALTVLFLFSPLLLIFMPKNISNKFVLIMGLLMVFSRVIEPLFFDTQLRMIIDELNIVKYLS